jgi:hypothetical protein
LHIILSSIAVVTLVGLGFQISLLFIEVVCNIFASDLLILE